MHDRYDYEPREYADWSGFSDTDPVAEPIIDYNIWPPDPRSQRPPGTRACAAWAS